MTVGVPDWGKAGITIDSPIEVYAASITVADSATWTSAKFDMRRFQSVTINFLGTGFTSYTGVLRKLRVEWTNSVYTTATEYYEFHTQIGGLEYVAPAKGGYLTLSFEGAATTIDDTYDVSVYGNLTPKGSHVRIYIPTLGVPGLAADGTDKLAILTGSVAAGASTFAEFVTWPGDATLSLYKNFNFTTAGSIVRVALLEGSSSNYRIVELNTGAAGVADVTQHITVPNRQCRLYLSNGDSVAHTIQVSLAMNQRNGD